MKHTRQILALLLAAAMLLCLAACGRTDPESSESGKSSGRKKTNETPAPEFVYKASFAPIDTGSDQMRDFYPRLTTDDAYYGFIREKSGKRDR